MGFWLNTWISNWYKIWNRPWRKQVKRRRLVSSCTWRWPSSGYRLIWTRSSAVWIRWNRSGRRTATLQLRRTARWSRSARSRQCTTRCLVYPTRRRRGSPSETWTGRPLPLSSAGPSWRSTSWPDCVIDELSDRRRTLPIKRHCFLLFFFLLFFFLFFLKKENQHSECSWCLKFKEAFKWISYFFFIFKFLYRYFLCSYSLLMLFCFQNMFNQIFFKRPIDFWNKTKQQ